VRDGWPCDRRALVEANAHVQTAQQRTENIRHIYEPADWLSKLARILRLPLSSIGLN
jgi:hypothetical protein